MFTLKSSFRSIALFGIVFALVMNGCTREEQDELDQVLNPVSSPTGGNEVPTTLPTSLELPTQIPIEVPISNTGNWCIDDPYYTFPTTENSDFNLTYRWQLGSAIEYLELNDIHYELNPQDQNQMTLYARAVYQEWQDEPFEYSHYAFGWCRNEGSPTFDLTFGMSFAGLPELPPSSDLYFGYTWECNLINTCSVVGVESVTTEAGTFASLRIDETVNDPDWPGHKTYWIAQGIGMVKMEKAIAGAVEYVELVSFTGDSLMNNPGGVSSQNPTPDPNEARIRYMIADMQLGGVADYYRQFTSDPVVAEAVARWDAGVRVVNINQFERKIVGNQGWQVVYAGTDTIIDGMDVVLTSD